MRISRFGIPERRQRQPSRDHFTVTVQERPDMHCRRTIATVLILNLAFFAAAGAQTSSLQNLIAQHEQELAQARSSRSQIAEATELNVLASLYRQTGNLKKGLDYCNQALALEQSAGFRLSAAYTKDTMGRIYTDLGEEDKALDLFNEILPYWESDVNRKTADFMHQTRLFTIGHASTLSNLGRVYNNLGDRQKALDYLNQALPIWQDSGNASGQASTLDSMGRAHSDMGDGQQAMEYFNRAMPLWAADGDRNGEALTLNDMGPA
jgi:tetratricopeptide (TPR) repeat protein